MFLATDEVNVSELDLFFLALEMIMRYSDDDVIFHSFYYTWLEFSLNGETSWSYCLLMTMYNV